LNLFILDTIAVAVFTLEYLLRIYTVVESPGHKHGFFGRFKYARSGNAIIDILAVLPFFLEAFLHHLFDITILKSVSALTVAQAHQIYRQYQDALHRNQKRVAGHERIGFYHDVARDPDRKSWIFV